MTAAAPSIVETVTAEAIRQAITLRDRVEMMGGGLVPTAFKVSPATMLAMRLATTNQDMRYAVTVGPVNDQVVADAAASSRSLRADLFGSTLYGVRIMVDDDMPDGVVEIAVRLK